jgi:homocysteine S-methyltransferase
MNNEIPGCDVPSYVMKRLANVADSKDSSLQEGIDIARETLEQIKSDINGVQISAPFGRVKSVIDVLEGSGI